MPTVYNNLIIIILKFWLYQIKINKTSNNFSENYREMQKKVMKSDKKSKKKILI